MPLTLQYLVIIAFAIVLIPLVAFFWRQWRILHQKNIKLEQKLRAQEKLIAQTNDATELWQNKFNAIFQESLDAHLVINRKSGQIIAINRAAQKILGYSHNDLLGQHFSVLLFNGAALSQEEIVNSLSAYGTVFESQKFLHQDGSVYPMDLTATFISWEKDGALLATLRDVTEREQLRSEIANQYNLLTLLINNIPDSIYFKDANGKIQMCNTATAEMIGVRTPDELLGKTDFDYLPQELARQNYEIEQQIIKSGTALINYEETGLPADSEVRWGLTTKVPFRDINGNITGIIGIRRDITERKQIEKILWQQAQELSRSNADLEQFAYIVSHDLQEPLRMVTTYLKLLSQRLPDNLDTDSQDFINYAVDGATRMRQLIQDLLAYSRVGTRGETPEPIECEAALNDALANLEAAIKESNATIIYGSLPTLLADKGQLRQLFQNLIGNAIKFSPNKPPQIKINAEKKDEGWLISVQDNGIGIAEDAKERIFNVFQRLHTVNEYPGTGIGLAICRKIVQRHRGRIWVESTPGQGSTFYFTIPNPEMLEPNKRSSSWNSGSGNRS